MGGTQGGATRTVERIFDSSLEAVDAAEALVVDIASQAGFEEEDLHQLGMAVRESMVNAVVHGNRYSVNKKVRMVIENNGKRFQVTIQDQGEGFDVSSIPDPLAEENLLRQSGRGLLLIRAFVDEFEVRSLVPSGTEARLVKYRKKQ
ncbi:MAG: ATP-binding protein [Acidobacteria bacterium]|nr:ATP-binding protein [Acidobacteriota bacterium]MBI3278550.1 ATP-binding protein [Acidobacteriota bacterium]